MPCNNPQLKEELIKRILLQNPNYSNELVERAITACCTQNAQNIEACASERAKQLYLIEYNRE